MTAISFPYSLASFANLLPIESVTWQLKRNDQIDGLENGQILTSEDAPPLWSGTVNIRPLSYEAYRPISAAVNALDGSLQAFMMFGPPALYPLADPTGSILGAATPTILSLDADNKRITLTGLPVGYVLSAGDNIQFPFATTLNAFHQIVAGGVADGSGHATIELRPHVHPGTLTGVAVTLIKPAARVVMVPGTYQAGQVRGTKVTGMTFDVIERFN
jgi:hypothetical protein